MSPNVLHLAPAKKLKTLKEIDIFHPWNSLDEHRRCGRCGQVFTGREIRVCRGWQDGKRYRLECPTEGCPSVPIEWMVVTAQAESETFSFRWFARD